MLHVECDEGGDPGGPGQARVADPRPTATQSTPSPPNRRTGRRPVAATCTEPEPGQARRHPARPGRGRGPARPPCRGGASSWRGGPQRFSAGPPQLQKPPGGGQSGLTRSRASAVTPGRASEAPYGDTCRQAAPSDSQLVLSPEIPRAHCGCARARVPYCLLPPLPRIGTPHRPPLPPTSPFKSTQTPSPVGSTFRLPRPHSLNDPSQSMRAPDSGSACSARRFPF